MNHHAPFFSIGVTSYKRIFLLKQCLDSILNQKFQDYEIIIGNDDPLTKITYELLGVRDERIRIVNHPENLTEVKNMNFLLSQSRGKYFTWLADDDIHHDDYLTTMYKSINYNHYPACVFSNFSVFTGSEFPTINPLPPSLFKIYSGKEFLNNYLVGSISTISVYGMFEVQFLKDIGGLENPSEAGIGLYGEYLFLLGIISLEEIIYLNNQLILFRSPVDGGGVWSNTSLIQYQNASEALIKRGYQTFTTNSSSIREFLIFNKFLIKPISDTMKKWMSVNGKITILELIRYIRRICSGFDIREGKLTFGIATLLIIKEAINQVLFQYFQKQGAGNILRKIYYMFYD